jgi:hypothetical protein
LEHELAQQMLLFVFVASGTQAPFRHCSFAEHAAPFMSSGTQVAAVQRLFAGQSLAAEQPQVPLTQMWPFALSAQSRPHSPQFEALVCVLTQVPAHAVSPEVVHCCPQTPPAQVATPPVGGGHTVPQPLQFAGSVCRLTQLDPHAVSPDGQLVMHCPPEHTSPDEHS